MRFVRNAIGRTGTRICRSPLKSQRTCHDVLPPTRQGSIDALGIGRHAQKDASCQVETRAQRLQSIPKEAHLRFVVREGGIFVE